MIFNRTFSLHSIRKNVFIMLCLNCMLFTHSSFGNTTKNLRFKATVVAPTCDISLDSASIDKSVSLSQLNAAGAQHVFLLGGFILTLSSCSGHLSSGKNLQLKFTGNTVDSNPRHFRTADSSNQKSSIVFDLEKIGSGNIMHNCSDANVLNYHDDSNLLSWPESSDDLSALNDSTASLQTGICIPADGNAESGRLHAALDITLVYP